MPHSLAAGSAFATRRCQASRPCRTRPLRHGMLCACMLCPRVLCSCRAAQCCIAPLCNLHVCLWELEPAGPFMTYLEMFTFFVWHAGPVDGPVLFNNCSSSQVAVACQQFQAKGCKDIDFGEAPCSSMVHVGT